MRGCPTAETLRAYFDGELSAPKLAIVAAHLTSCKSCASAAQEMEKQIETLSKVFAPLFSLPVPVARLHERLNFAINTLPAPTNGLNGQTGFNVAAILGRLSALLPTVPRPLAGFASLVITLILVTAIALEFDFRVKEIAKNDTRASSGAPADSKPAGSANSRASEAPFISNAVPAVPSQDKSSDAAEHQKAGWKSGGLKSLRDTRQRATTRESFTERRESSPRLGRDGLIRGEQQYLNDIAMLTASLDGGPKLLQPILRVEYERNLAVVDVAINATRRVALENPDDVNALKFLLAAYRSKVKLLRVVASRAQAQSFNTED